MINEVLTNSVWLDPQINFLLMLQNIRLSLGSGIENFFFSLTVMGEFLFPTLVMSVIYWCIDTSVGLLLFISNSLSLAMIQVLKMSACVYRPWILSDKLSPPQMALKTAESYSFPSGHSIMAASLWGAIAYILRHKVWACVLLISFVILIGFSRCYLCVHTPQDVVIGLFAGILLIFCAVKLIDWCNKDKKRFLYIFGFGNFILFIILFWVLKKHYPIDYYDGKILVNPIKAVYISVIYIAWVAGMFNGAILCKRFLNYDAQKGSIKAKIIRGLLGALTFSGLFYVIENYFLHSVQDYKLAFMMMIFTGFYITLIYPYIIMKLQKYIDI